MLCFVGSRGRTEFLTRLPPIPPFSLTKGHNTRSAIRGMAEREASAGAGRAHTRDRGLFRATEKQSTTEPYRGRAPVAVPAVQVLAVARLAEGCGRWNAARPREVLAVVRIGDVAPSPLPESTAHPD